MMLKQYILLALRLMVRNKALSFIKVMGLALGLAASMLTLLYVKDELSYDSQNRLPGQLYRIASRFKNDRGEQIAAATTAPALAPALVSRIPEIENASRIFTVRAGEVAVKYADKSFLEQHLFHTDSSFFDIFRMNFVAGNRKALNDPAGIVITQSMAKKYFGKGDPMGKTLQVEDWLPKHVTAVIEDLPGNVHFKPDFLVSLLSLHEEEQLKTNWDWQAFYSYIRLKPGADIVTVEKKINALVEQLRPEGRIHYFAQPLTGIHLTSNLQEELSINGSLETIYFLMGLCVLVLVIACINYINLSTANAVTRSREIGVRKATGALRSALINQFLTESLCYSLLAGATGLVLALLFLPAVNSFTNKDLYLFGKDHSGLLLLYGAATLAVGLLSGIYPAFYLSAANPVSALKGKSASGSGGLRFRQLLVVTQFTVSIALIIAVMVVKQQLAFIRASDLGLNPNKLIQVKYTIAGNREEAAGLKDQWLQIKGVDRVSAMSESFVENTWPLQIAYRGSNFQIVNSISVDTDFLATMGISLREGRNFYSDTIAANGREVILNESAVRALGLEKPVIGSRLAAAPNLKSGLAIHYTVVGVVKDFHFSSLKTQISPFMFEPVRVKKWVYMLKLSGPSIEKTIAEIKAVWNRNILSRPFAFNFVNEEFDQLYVGEMRLKTIIDVIGGLTMLLSCMGLIGLSSFVILQRAKEISIRKILGASIFSIARLLSNEFAGLIIISSLIAFPISFLLMNKWLQGYAYRIAVPITVFFLAAALVIATGILTISFQTIKAAIKNPVSDLNRQ